MRPLALFALLALAAAALAQQAAPGVRIQSPTRQVTQFGDLEGQLWNGVAHHDRAALEPLLADDFAYRAARTGGAIMGRGEWLEHAAAGHDLHGYRFAGLDVRQFADVAVVSYLCHVEAGQPGVSGDYFIVDAWRRTDAGWKLAARYSAGPAGVPPLPAAPTGKE
jgi:uncharacterized protein DUF4440